MNKKAFEMEFMIKILLWIIFLGVAIYGLTLLVKKFTM